MQEVEKAYSAGFFDGEGSIYISRGRKLKTGYQYFLCISINNTDKPIIDLFQQWFNGKISINPDTRTRRKLMRLRIYSIEAMKFLRILMPYLKVKLKQAQLALEFQEQMSVRKLTDEEKTFYKKTISQYNQKGRIIA